MRFVKPSAEKKSPSQISEHSPAESNTRSGSIFEIDPLATNVTPYPSDFTKPGNRFKAVAWFRPNMPDRCWVHGTTYNAEQLRALGDWCFQAAEHIDASRTKPLIPKK